MYRVLLMACLVFCCIPGPVRAMSAVCTDRLVDVAPEDLLAVRLDMVARAREGESVRVLAYIFGDDDSGLRLLRALIAASRRGVTVQLLLDGLGPGPVHPFSDELVAAIQTLAPSFDIKLFHPKYQLWNLHRRMHDKLFLVGDSAVVGSSAAWDASTGGWLLEKDIVVHGRAADPASALAAMHRHFTQFWDYAGSVSQQPLRSMGLALPHEEGNGAGKLDPARVQIQLQRLTTSAPESRLSTVNLAALERHECEQLAYLHDSVDKNSGDGMWAAMQALLAQARREIVIVSPYVILPPRLHALLQAQVRAGVRVRIITTSVVSLAHEFAAIARAYTDDLPALSAAGIEVAEFRAHEGRQMLHAKLVRVDGNAYYVGSFNFDPLSAYSSTENGVLIRPAAEGSVFAQTMDAQIDAYLKQSQIISDGTGRLPQAQAHRCDEINCYNPLRWLAPLIRSLL